MSENKVVNFHPESVATFTGIYTDTTIINWTKENSPYIITETVVIDSGITLKVEPGTVAKFEPGAALIIKGILNAEGTIEDSIKFTSSGMFDQENWKLWSGIQFENCSNSSILKYCIVEYGVDKCITIKNSSPTISHCKLRYIVPSAETGGAIIICTDSSTPLIEYNVISEFYNYAATGIYCISSNPEIFHNDIICCETECIAVIGGGFLDGNYLAIDVLIGIQEQYMPDTSLGEPIDQIGDGICNTTSTDSLQLFRNVDGVKNPRSIPDFPF